jgi:predicted PurR-regulated permease PerM
MIYLFFLLYYRTKLKSSILNFFSDENQSSAKDVLADTIKLALDFLIGRMILIAFLVVIYGIGLSISGIDNAILISILAAILSLIPYVGNLIGVILAMSMAAFSGGGLTMYIGVGVTFFFAQFIESYILQPYVVGGKVNINPIVTIIVVVLGGTIWGVAGMILSIPLIGIFKIICDAVPVLHPIGYFLGEEDLGSDDEEPGKLTQLGKNIWSKISGKD